MNNKLFSHILEIIWLIVGVAAAVASVNSFLTRDTNNGYLMLMFAVVGFVMFLVRRRLRLHQRSD